MGYSASMLRVVILPLLLLTAAAASAGEFRRIELTDGSVLAGEVLSYQNGTYQVRTHALGTISIEDSRIRSIGTPGNASPTANPTPAVGQIRSLQEQMQSDEQVMDIIRSLKDDPAFRQVLEDPAVLKAIEAGDLSTLMTNPKFMQLMNNPKTLEIKNKVIN